jgi:hypothetical protein
MPIEHSDIGLAEIHKVHNWEYANAAARTGASGFIASDVGKWAKQLDDGSFWELTAVTPTWAQRTGTGAEIGANSDITSMDGLTGALQSPTMIDFPEAAAPGTPAASKVRLYAKADGLLYSKDDAGTETVVTGGGGGGGTPGGATTQIQFNDGGAFGGDAGLVWDKTNDIMTLLAASGKIRTGTGLAATPSFSFTGFTNYGFYHDGGNAIIASAGGAEIIGINTASVSVKIGKSLGFASALGATGMSAGFRNPATGQIAVVNQDSDTIAATIYNPTRTMAAPAGVPTPNLREGNVQRHTMTGNITVGAPANMVDGIIFTLIFIQDGTGSRTAAWNAVYKWAGGSAPTLSTGAGAVDIFRFWTNGTNAYELSRALNVS